MGSARETKLKEKMEKGICDKECQCDTAKQSLAFFEGLDLECPSTWEAVVEAGLGSARAGKEKGIKTVKEAIEGVGCDSKTSEEEMAWLARRKHGPRDLVSSMQY